MMTASQMIRSYRESHGMSQVYLSKKTGIDSDKISQWECGYIRVPADDFFRIVTDGFGVSLDIFFAEQLSKNENEQARIFT